MIDIAKIKKELVNTDLPTKRKGACRCMCFVNLGCDDSVHFFKDKHIKHIHVCPCGVPSLSPIQLAC